VEIKQILNENSSIGGYDPEDDFLYKKVYVDEQIWELVMSRGVIPFVYTDWAPIDTIQKIFEKEEPDYSALLVNEVYALLLEPNYCDWHSVGDTYVSIPNCFSISPAVYYLPSLSFHLFPILLIRSPLNGKEN
jgi:hypothetical protein